MHGDRGGLFCSCDGCYCRRKVSFVDCGGGLFSLLYALRVLRNNHGIRGTSLHDVFRATIVAKLTYAAPAWSGACSAGDRAKLDAFVNRYRRLSYCGQNEPSLTQLMDDADERLFRRIMNNNEHVLQPFLPDRPDLSLIHI